MQKQLFSWHGYPLGHQPFHLPSQSFITPSAFLPSPTNFIRNFLRVMTSQECCQVGGVQGEDTQNVQMCMKHIYPSKCVFLAAKVPLKRLNSHPDVPEWAGFDWLRVCVNMVQPRWCQVKPLYIQTPLLLPFLLPWFFCLPSVFLSNPGESQKCACNSKRGLTAIFSAQGPNVDWESFRVWGCGA